MRAVENSATLQACSTKATLLLYTACGRGGEGANVPKYSPRPSINCLEGVLDRVRLGPAGIAEGEIFILDAQ